MASARSFNASFKSNTSPRIFNSCQLGSLNPDALKLPILRHKSLTATYDHIAQLSAEADRLQQENKALQQRLLELTSESNSDDPNESNNPFSSFKRREMQFSQKLIERDNELNAFASVINEYRVVKDPTFVEVAANASLKSRNQKQYYDSITTSLLVSNPQRPFFRRDDIEKQNEELRSMISQQEETLRLLRARLDLFHHHDQQNTLSFTISSLKKGQTPVLLQDSAPSKRSELEIKKRILTKELHKLIRKRKELAKERAAEKEKLRALALKALQNNKKANKNGKGKNKQDQQDNQQNQEDQEDNQQNQEEEQQNQQDQQNQEDQQQEEQQDQQNQEEEEQNQQDQQNQEEQQNQQNQENQQENQEDQQDKQQNQEDQQQNQQQEEQQDQQNQENQEDQQDNQQNQEDQQQNQQEGQQDLQEEQQSQQEDQQNQEDQEPQKNQEEPQ